MESCDVVDRFGSRIGRIVTRGTKLESGEYYPVVHIWIRNEHGKYLVQQRAPHLASSPGIWATTVGNVLAGEESLSGAIREVYEELGIQLSPSQLRHWIQIIFEDLFEDLWLVEISRNEIGIPMMGPEVVEWMWASKDEIAQKIKRGDFFGYSYFNDLPE